MTGPVDKSQTLSSWMGTGGGQCSDSYKCFNQLSQSAVYKQDFKSVSLTCCGGSYGGGSECIVVKAFDQFAVDDQ